MTIDELISHLTMFKILHNGSIPVVVGNGVHNIMEFDPKYFEVVDGTLVLEIA